MSTLHHCDEQNRKLNTQENRPRRTLSQLTPVQRRLICRIVKNKKKTKNVSTQAAARLFTRRHPQANITSRRRQQSSQYNVVPSQYASAISDREAKSKC